jgi:hypothetical protein
MDSIIELALAATAVAKTLIDLLRLATDLPRWGPPVGAIVVGIATVTLLALANGLPFTTQGTAQVILAGILAGGSAVGVTVLARTADSTVVTRRGGP